MVGGLVWSVLSWSAISIRIADILYDNKLHNIPCDQLPQRELVERVLENNNAAVIAVEAMTEGSGWVEVGFLNDCPDKADIVIYFGGHRQRVRIEQLIGGDLWFGIPYRMINI